MLISIRHVTRYTYALPVGYAIQSVRLTPASFTGQRVLDWKVSMPLNTQAPSPTMRMGYRAREART